MVLPRSQPYGSRSVDDFISRNVDAAFFSLERETREADAIVDIR
jgi:hypothetical protein